MKKNKNSLFFLYLKFDEQNSVFKQYIALCKHYHINYKKHYVHNSDIVQYFGGFSKASVLSIIKAGLALENGQLTYIISNLNTTHNLLLNSVLFILWIFATFIIYSIFQVSIRKRMTQYSILQVIGLEKKHIFATLFTELFIIFTCGYLVGTGFGIAVSSFLYEKIGSIFVNQKIGVEHSASHLIQQHIDSSDSVISKLKIDAEHFYISSYVILSSFIILAFMLIIISFYLVLKMRHYSLRQMIYQNDYKKKPNRRIYSIKASNMADVLTRKFMFQRIRNFITLVFALSIGGCIFIGTSYMTKNTEKNNELTFKIDDGINSDIQLYEDSDNLNDVISSDTIPEIRKINGIKEANPMSYTLGEIPLKKGVLKWKDYFAEIRDPSSDSDKPDPEIMKNYNGQITKENDGSNKLKVNVYGYSNSMIKSLNDFLLDGSIGNKPLKDDEIILKTIMDGQGNYNGIDIKPGDTIRLKVPNMKLFKKGVLKFLNDDSYYIEKEFHVVAIVNRVLSSNNNFIGDDNCSNVNVVISDSQMRKYFNITDYNSVSIMLNKNANSAKVAKQLGSITTKIHNCRLKDATELVKQENIFLKQKMLFFYGIAIVIMIISILHIMNSMQYLIQSRKREFGIIRAMGITDSGFMKMLLKEGLLYGIYSSLFMVILYLILHKILYYVLIHILFYIHADFSLPLNIIFIMCLINIAICSATVILSGRSILKETIIDEIHS